LQLSPRLGPLLGSARNSPLIKRKTKGSAKAASRTSDTTPSPPMSEKDKSGDGTPQATSPGTPGMPSKAHKLLGDDVGPITANAEAVAVPGSAARKMSPRPSGGVQTVTKDFLRDLQSYKAASSTQLGARVSGAEGETHVVRKAMSSQTLASQAHHHHHAPPSLAVSPGPTEPEYDANDSIEVLRERLDTQKQRYEKWKKEHLDDTRTKLSIMMEENRKLQEQLADVMAQSEAWKTSYENVKQHATRAQGLWDEERTKLVKRYNEDQKKIERLQKKKPKPQGLPKDVGKSSIFGRGKPPTPDVSPTPMAPGAAGLASPVSMEKSMSVKGPAIGEPRLISHSATAERDSTPLPVPGSSASANNRIRKPEDFQLCSVVGQGGFGAVFLCKETATNRVCAVKRMAKSTIIGKEQVHTVNVEVNVLKEARLEDNPWIVQFYYAFQDSRYIYLAMEFCSGGDLRNLIDNVELDEDGVRFLAAEMIVSVNSLHERGYVHRDLKPSNFLISPTGHLKLADFGLSKSGFSGVKKSTGDSAQAIRVFLVDEAYKTLVVNNDTTVNEVIKQLKIKLRVPKNAPWLIYECNTISGLQRERPMALDERPLKVAAEWQKGLLYKFLFKEADQLRVQAMARTRVETSHKDPFFQREAKVTRRERMYSIVGSPHYMAAEILEGSGYDAVADWWSMGCILYEMLVGAPPFTATAPRRCLRRCSTAKSRLSFRTKAIRCLQRPRISSIAS
jgi:serine/threonine protein kinase